MVSASQIDQYEIQWDPSTGEYWDVTTAGTVHKLTPAQLKADVAAGATVVQVKSPPKPGSTPTSLKSTGVSGSGTTMTFGSNPPTNQTSAGNSGLTSGNV